MLREMSALDWRDWKVYQQLAPFSEERADIRTADICRTIAGVYRDTKAHPDPFTIEEFLLKFGDQAAPQPKKQAQTPDEIERHLTDWIQGANVIASQR